LIQRRWAKTMMFASAAALSCGLSACGGEVDLTCEKRQAYQESVEHEKLQAPDDLDPLEPLREIPLPKANPAQERPPGSPCVDLPPRLGSTN